MKQQYFGILLYELYESKKLESIIDFLSEKGICEKIEIHSYSGQHKETDRLGELHARSKLEEISEGIRFKSDLINEFYNFLLTHYKAGLGNHILFNLTLEQDIFGLNYEDSKTIALKYFHIYYNEIPIHLSFKYKFDKNRNTVPATMIESLKYYQDNLKSVLENKIEIIIPYLASNEEYYNRNLFENNSIIKEIFEFENNLKILLELNKKYKFEQDDIFTPPSISKRIYKEYSDQFHSLMQIEFIENQITKNEKVNRAFIKSLFHLFSNDLNINTPSGKLFGEIINDNFDYDFSEIKLNGSESTTHTNRVKKLKKEWENFIN